VTRSIAALNRTSGSDIFILVTLVAFSAPQSVAAAPDHSTTDYLQLGGRVHRAEALCNVGWAALPGEARNGESEFHRRSSAWGSPPRALAT
jgi:hypothetical protein